MKIKIPKGQIHWQSLCAIDGTIKQVVTSDEMKKKWHLYNVNDDGTLTKIETKDSPVFDKSIF